MKTHMLTTNASIRNYSSMARPEKPAAQSEPAPNLPTDSVTLSGGSDHNAVVGIGTMICGLMVGAGIASAVPILGGVIMLGSIFAGLSMAGN